MLTSKSRKRRLASYIGADVTETGAPANSVAPSISGTVQVGATLTASAGTWSGRPTYSYQWNADGAAIDGANGSTYVPVEGDVGAVITVTVTGLNYSSSASATSAPTAAVIAA